MKVKLPGIFSVFPKNKMLFERKPINNLNNNPQENMILSGFWFVSQKIEDYS